MSNRTGIMSDRPCVSVVLPVYNGAAFLREAIDSVLAQTFSDFELIAIDDGSTDASGDIIRSYDDARLRLLAVPHAGLVAALNAGLARARGRYIARMDSDDRAKPQRLERQVAFLELHPEISILCSDVAIIDAAGLKTGRQTEHACTTSAVRDAMLYRIRLKPVIHPSVMMRRTVFETLGGYRDYHCAEDHDFWLRATDHFGFARLNELLLDYRIYDGGISRTRALDQAVAAAASSVDYLVERASGVSLYRDRPDVLTYISELLHQRITRDVLPAALAYRHARSQFARRRWIAVSIATVVGVMRYGKAFLPSYEMRLIRKIVEDAVKDGTDLVSNSVSEARTASDRA